MPAETSHWLFQLGSSSYISAITIKTKQNKTKLTSLYNHCSFARLQKEIDREGLN